MQTPQFPPSTDFTIEILSINEDKTSAVVRMVCDCATIQFQIKLVDMFGMPRVENIGKGMKNMLAGTPAYDDSIPYQDEIETQINKLLSQL